MAVTVESVKVQSSLLRGKDDTILAALLETATALASSYQADDSPTKDWVIIRLMELDATPAGTDSFQAGAQSFSLGDKDRLRNNLIEHLDYSRIVV